METVNDARRWPMHLTTLVPVLILWLAYSTLQTLGTMEQVSVELNTLLGFLPGLLGIAVLRAGGFPLADCYLQVRPLSRPGLAVLAGVYVFALGAILPFGVWQGWDWVAALVYAPAGGVAQELFFRAVLLPVLLSISKNRLWLALTVHSALFGLWHIGPLFIGAPLVIVFAVMLVPFLSGLGWGWAVHRDQTVLWAMVQPPETGSSGYIGTGEPVVAVAALGRDNPSCRNPSP
jgi:membrane protease YdiL (CAAX protease family)